MQIAQYKKLSNEEKITEYMKCREDPVYFINNYCYIVHPVEGEIPFKTYDFQDKIINDYLNKRFNITNKSRQTGISTVTACFTLWDALFHNSIKIVIISIKDKDAQSFLKKVKTAFKLLPDWLKGGDPYTNNAHELLLRNGSSIMSVASGSEAARGEAISRLIVDEAAFISGIEDIWTAAYPTLSRGGSAILISTPNGVGGFFYEQWNKSQLKEVSEDDFQVNFNANFVHWTQIPEYRSFDDIEGMTFSEIVEKAKQGRWYKEMRSNFSDKKWAQEFEGDFLGSGNTLIDNGILKRTQLEDWLKDPEFRYDAEFNESPTGGLWVWEEPKEGKTYLVAADVASGEGSDYNAVQVIDLESGDQVAEYRGKLDMTKYADFLIELATRYNYALLVPELNGLGIGLVHMLAYERMYQNIFFQKNEETQKIKKRKYGWSTSRKTRPLLLTYLESSTRSMEFKWYSKRLWNEMSTFVWKEGGRCEAESGCNDDLVMAYAIAMYNRQTALIHRPMNISDGKTEYSVEIEYAENSELNKINRKDMFSGLEEKDSHTPLGIMGGNEYENYDWLK